MLLGEGLCFVILHFVVPMWTNFLDKNFSPTPEDVDRIVSSRFGVVVVLLVLLPWVFFYLLTFLTAVFTGEMASLVTNQRRVQSTALVVTMAVAAAAGPAAIAWVVTGRLYPDANSVALLVQRSLLSSGSVLLAALFAATSDRRSGNRGLTQVRPAAFATCLLAIGVVTAVIVGIRHEEPKTRLNFNDPGSLVKNLRQPMPVFNHRPRSATSPAVIAPGASTAPATVPDRQLKEDSESARVARLRQASDAGDSDAMTKLGLMYLNGLHGLVKDEHAAGEFFTKAAASGNAPAMNELGLMHGSGRGGFPVSDVEAVRWYRKAAESGDGLAMSNLASCYLLGRGVAQDDTAAAAWYRRGAEAGEPMAMGGLADMYLNGRGARQDDSEAARWYRRAAESGMGMAMNNLGTFYFDGLHGIAKDEAEGLRWFRKGADAGCGLAMANLARVYYEGISVARDLVEAVKWCRKAADLGDPTGMFMLGLLHAEGSGVAKDDAQARKWIRRAADAGKTEARQWLTENP